MIGMDMIELNEEIKLTLNLMQTDIDEGAHSELQSHLYSLLELKRNELQQRLVERSWLEPVSCTIETVASTLKLASSLLIKVDNPLTAEELKAGGWWCDRSGGNRGCLRRKKIDYVECLTADGCYVFYAANCTGDVKEIHRIGNDFYWGQK